MGKRREVPDQERDKYPHAGLCKLWGTLGFYHYLPVFTLPLTIHSLLTNILKWPVTYQSSSEYKDWDKGE